jgi:hypothetical protein
LFGTFDHPSPADFKPVSGAVVARIHGISGCCMSTIDTSQIPAKSASSALARALSDFR